MRDSRTPALSRGRSSSARFTAAVFFFYGAFELAMTVATLALPPLAAYGDIADTPIRAITFIVPIVVSLLRTFGFILMANQRLNSENAEEREKMRMIFELSPDAVLITRLVDEIVSTFPNAASVRIEKRLGDFVLGAAVLQPMGLIVNELLINIMKYAFAGRDGCTISVSASLEGAIVPLVIADDGNGMPPTVDYPFLRPRSSMRPETPSLR